MGVFWSHAWIEVFIASRPLIWPMKDSMRKRSVKRWSAIVPNPSTTESASTRTTTFIWAIWRKTRLASSSRDRSYIRLAQSPELSWVDSLSFGPEGKLYAVVNQLHRSAALNGGEALSKPPYLLIEVNALAAGLPGR